MTAYSVSGAQRAVHLGKSREEAAHADVCPQAWERQMGDFVYLFLFDFTKKVKNFSALTSCKAPRNQDYDHIPWLTWSKSHTSLICSLRFLLRISGCLHRVLQESEGRERLKEQQHTGIPFLRQVQEKPGPANTMICYISFIACERQRREKGEG